MNIVLLFVSMAVAFGALVLVKRFFGATGVVGFMGLATVLANIFICKSVTLAGYEATLGNVMFASNFLATDILTECYGAKEARKGVAFAIVSAIGFLVATQIAMQFTPGETDIAQGSFETLFTLTPRITLASVALFALSNFADVGLYEYIRRKTGGRALWLRNNLCTIVCNGAENFAFYFIAFAGVFETGALLSMSITATVIETLIAICDTPFAYLGRKVKTIGGDTNWTERQL